jgi:hypothetical protein
MNFPSGVTACFADLLTVNQEIMQKADDEKSPSDNQQNQSAVPQSDLQPSDTQ